MSIGSSMNKFSSLLTGLWIQKAQTRSEQVFLFFSGALSHCSVRLLPRSGSVSAVKWMKAKMDLVLVVSRCSGAPGGSVMWSFSFCAHTDLLIL